MARVELQRNAGGNKQGTVINVGQGQADHLIANGYAKLVEEAPKKSAPRKSRRADSELDADGGGASPSEEATTAG